MTLSRRAALVLGAGLAGVPLAGCASNGSARSPGRASTRSVPVPASGVPTVVPGGRRLPDDLLLGYSTAAYQIEGAVAEDGRKPSIWDTFCQRPGVIDDGTSGAVACDHYHRWAGDVDLMAGLNTQTYRFSIAWPRIVPDGVGRVNAKGVDFYRRLVDRLRARGIVPMATLYHWDLPQVLQDRGGWQNRDVAEWFADYATAVFEQVDGVDRWITINEPKVIVRSGHIWGTMAPGIKSEPAAGRVLHHLNLGHGRAVQAFRAAGSPGRIGMCCAATPCYPADDSKRAATKTAIADAWQNTIYLDPVLRGRYPALTAKQPAGFVRGLRQAERDGDLAVISQPIDYLGINYYSPTVVAGSGAEVHRYPRSASGQQLHPPALTDLLVRMHRDYGLPMMITETGIPDYPARDWRQDTFRIDYVRDHLGAILDAVDAGATIEGVYLWSLMDNWEWARGFTQRWGLVRVDYDTQERIPKASAQEYAAIARARIVPL